MPENRDTVVTIRTTDTGKTRLELEAKRGPDSPVSLSRLVRESLDTLLLVAEARGQPLRQVVSDLRAQHLRPVLNERASLEREEVTAQ